MDGVATPDEYAERAVDINMPALAITDHGSLSGHRDFYKSMKSHGIKPILGIEAYIASDRFDRRDKAERTTPLDLVYNHLVIVAKDQTGLENLNRLNEIAWTEGFFKKPRIDFEVLEKHREGLIVSSACPSGLIAKAIEHDELAIAKSHLRWFAERFEDDFYVEVMPHTDAKINHALVELADTHKMKMITTADCHHATVDQKVIQEFMLILNTHAKFAKDIKFEESLKIEDMMKRLDYLYGEDRMMSFRNFDIHLQSYEEQYNSMAAQGIERHDLLENTLEIADKVQDYNLPQGLNLLPIDEENPSEQLESIAISGLKNKGLSDKDEYVERLREELAIIKEKDFAAYFLVVQNMLNWAKDNGIMVGPGRGSAAGSLVCYALGITDIDPIEYNLLFFRFINPERNDFPDIDSDIQDDRRDEVKDYLVSEYKNVASIATFLTFKDKGVVRDVARTLNIPLQEVNKALKQVDTWEEYVSSPTTRWFREKYPQVELYGDQIRGRIRGTGIHAAGVVTSKEPIFKYAPMETRLATGTKERIPVVAVDMEQAADIGLIKIDALGLKTLTVINETLRVIKERNGQTIDLNSINKADKNIYEMLSSGYTKGVFQCEATPYTNLLVKMGVSTFDELVASNALVRPGAMNTIGKEYIAIKQGKKQLHIPNSILADITKETYGCILYQEQVMLACVKLGDMTMAEADKVRKIIGKKKDAKEFDIFKEQFVRGASGKIDRVAAEKMWHDFEAHAGYSFNKSHAVAYSTLSFWTAWLKYYYPLEFMYSLLKSEKDKDARTEYLIEAKRMGITLKLPHINESDIDFKIEGKAIRFGLTSIKYISDNVASKYMAARPFKSLAELEKFTYTKGSGTNSRSLSALKAVGAATFEDNPRDEEEVRQNLYEYLNLPEFNISVPAHFYAYLNESDDYEETGVYVILGVVKNIKRGKGWSRVDIMDKKGSIGVFDDEDTKLESGKTYLVLIGDNRVMEAVPADDINKFNNPFTKFMNYKSLPYKDEESYIISFKPRVTKAGKKMASLVVADSERELHSIVVFPTAFAQAFMKCEPGSIRNLTLGKTKEGTITLQEVK